LKEAIGAKLLRHVTVDDIRAQGRMRVEEKAFRL
jgi:hypothetical protein